MAKKGTKRGKSKSHKPSPGDLTPRPSSARQVRGGVSKGVLNTKAITLPPPAYPPIA